MTVSRTRKQHYISRVVLRQFCDASGHLAMYDLRTGKQHRKAPKGVGYFKDFIQDRPNEFEQLWKMVEDPLPRALRALRKGRRAMTEDEVGIIKACVAVHFARNPALKRWEARLMPELLAQVRAELLVAEPELVIRGFVNRFGRVPSSGEELRAFVRSYDAGTDLVEGSGFSGRLTDLFGKTLSFIRDWDLQVAIAVGSLEFVIGDTPALSFESTTNSSGLGVVALGDASGILMPLGPRVIVCVAKPGADVTCDDAAVERFNGYQVANASSGVMYTPSKTAAAWVRAQRPPNDA